MCCNKDRCFLMNILCFKRLENKAMQQLLVVECILKGYANWDFIAYFLLTWMSFVWVSCTVHGFPNFTSFLIDKAWFFKNLKSRHSWSFILLCFKSLCHYRATAALLVSIWILDWNLFQRVWHFNALVFICQIILVLCTKKYSFKFIHFVSHNLSVNDWIWKNVSYLWNSNTWNLERFIWK